MQEILTLDQLSQLVEEYTALKDWTLVRNFCEQVYGPGMVNTATLETYGEYNDEGGTDYSVETIYAVDAESEAVEYDLALPFWQAILGDNHEDAEDALKDWYPTRKEKGVYLSWQDLPCDPHTGDRGVYNLTEMPKTSFVVYPVDGAAELAAKNN